jgi:hypothetical protein
VVAVTWLSQRFQFQVGCYRERGVTDAVTGEPLDAYHVALPHSCDTWDVAYAHSREEAIADLEAFITEAQLALAELRTHPVGDPDDETPRSFP